jgi:hypothetical protein
MTDQTTNRPYDIADDEKLSQVMVYTDYSLCWGEVATKEIVRVSTWLRTNAAPDNMLLYNARCLPSQSSQSLKPTGFNELHIPTHHVLAYHLLPPAQDPLDYDPRDGLRRLEPVTVMSGPYRFDGNLLLAQKSNLTKFIEISKEVYTSLYDVEITYPLMASMGKLKVPFLLFRFTDALLSTRSATSPTATTQA